MSNPSEEQLEEYAEQSELLKAYAGDLQDDGLGDAARSDTVPFAPGLATQTIAIPIRGETVAASAMIIENDLRADDCRQLECTPPETLIDASPAPTGVLLRFYLSSPPIYSSLRARQ